MWPALMTSVLLLTQPLHTSAIGERSFARLRAGYASRDAAVAASAYAATAQLIYRYSGAPVERYRGRAAIRSSFAALFAQIDTAQRLDLNFRITSRRGRDLAGLYRLRIGTAQVTYGYFVVRLDGDGRFTRDVSRDATAAEFDAAPAALMFAATENATTAIPAAR